MKKIFSLLLVFFAVFMFYNTKVFASKATCEYSTINNKKITYTYEYGKKLDYKTSDAKYTIKSQPLANKDFVDADGNISCPKLKISCTTTAKQRWGCTITKNSTDGKAGTLKILTQDDAEKGSPNSNNQYCNYNVNANLYSYSLAWVNGKVIYELSSGLKDYKVTIRNCTEEHFKNKCPEVYDQMVHKSKSIIIDCTNKIFTENDKTNTPDSSTNVDTGQTNSNPNNDQQSGNTNSGNSGNNGNYATEDDFIGNLSCGGTSFQFHKSLPNFTNVIFDLLKIATPIIIIITGMLDMLKAVSAQKEDEIKKGQQKFLRRLLAGAVVFLVFVIVETVIHTFAESNEAQNAMDCVDCFLIDSDSCTRN